ncbi:MAG: hypothetical protein QXE81_01445 [Desulfurococcaceae archaeon]
MKEPVPLDIMVLIKRGFRDLIARGLKILVNYARKTMLECRWEQELITKGRHIGFIHMITSLSFLIQYSMNCN